MHSWRVRKENQEAGSEWAFPRTEHLEWKHSYVNCGERSAVRCKRRGRMDCKGVNWDSSYQTRRNLRSYKKLWKKIHWRSEVRERTNQFSVFRNTKLKTLEPRRRQETQQEPLRQEMQRTQPGAVEWDKKREGQEKALGLNMIYYPCFHHRRDAKST